MEKKASKTETAGQQKYHNELFEKIADEKRSRIIEASLVEFSSKGFNAANINVIAKNAGISIGSMYQYFESKENLFLAVMDIAYGIIEKSLETIDRIEGDIYSKLDTIVGYIQKYSREYKLLNRIYLEATTQGLANMSRKLSLKMESVSSTYYRKIISAAIKEGIIDKKISPSTAAFCLDNILLLLQFSYSSDYYAERMKIFVSDDVLENDARIRKEIVYFLKKALQP